MYSVRLYFSTRSVNNYQRIEGIGQKGIDQFSLNCLSTLPLERLTLTFEGYVNYLFSI